MTPTPKERLIQIAEQQLPALKRELLDIAKTLDCEKGDSSNRAGDDTSWGFTWGIGSFRQTYQTTPLKCGNCTNTYTPPPGTNSWLCGRCGCYNSV